VAKLNRFTSVIKRKWSVNPNNNLDIIVLAAGAGKMTNCGPRSLLDIKNEKLGQRQVRIIRECYPNANIIYGLGFQADKVIDSLPQNIMFVENMEYESTSQVRTLAMCLRVSLNPCVILIMGDLLFNNEYISDLYAQTSNIIYDTDHFRPQEIGLNSYDDNLATLFAYNLVKKWGQVGFFTGAELYNLRKYVYNKENRTSCMFEALNYIIDNGGKLITKKNNHGFVLEIDGIKDLEKI
jgi:choline kinase